MRTVLEVSHLSKSYGEFTAVNDLSFAVHAGEIFGLLGPNGAGKTTTIRILMDIFKADGGDVRVLGDRPAAVRERVGYLPEERGLYKDLKVMEALVYLAQLKGVAETTARRNAAAWLERVELQGWSKHKVKDLSRGMQQKVQFVASLVHDPELLILDEPFQGLDPVNVELLKKLIRELQVAGKTIVLSAHQMNLVEELCDRIVLISRGQAVLYGALTDIKREFAPHAVRVKTSGDVSGIPGVREIKPSGAAMLLELDGATPQAVLAELVRRGVDVQSFEVASVPLNDIFVQVVQRGTEEVRKGFSP
ncbi:MAG: ATP-binding cassette domain-containing protein [Chloroflexi bacterium]|nr:ATP-binding cassette domain-containing protein [Chloroflexota bacterium]